MEEDKVDTDSLERVRPFGLFLDLGVKIKIASSRGLATIAANP